MIEEYICRLAKWSQMFFDTNDEKEMHRTILIHPKFV